MYLLSTKPMAKWSRAPGQFLGGQWVEHKAELSNFLTYFLIFLKFSDISFVSNFQQRVAKLGAFPINLIIFKVQI